MISGFDAFVSDQIDSSSPAFQIGCPEEGSGDVRVEGNRGMLAQKAIHGPAFRHLPGVPDHQLIGINADLHRGGNGIVLMRRGVNQGFPKAGTGNRKGFDTLQTVVCDTGLEIFRIEQFHNRFKLGEEIAVDFIVIEQIRICTEKADFNVSPGY